MVSYTGFWTDMLLLCTAVEDALSTHSHKFFHMERAAGIDVSAKDSQEPSTANFIRLQEVCCLLCSAYADTCAVGGADRSLHSAQHLLVGQRPFAYLMPGSPD